DVALDVGCAVLARARALGAAGVVLADPPHLRVPAREGDDGRVGPAQGGSVRGLDLGADGRERARLLALAQGVHALFLEVDEDDQRSEVVRGAAVGFGHDGPARPAVLVHAGAGVVGGGQHGDGLGRGGIVTVGGAAGRRQRDGPRGADDRLATARGGYALGPPHGV